MLVCHSFNGAGGLIIQRTNLSSMTLDGLEILLVLILIMCRGANSTRLGELLNLTEGRGSVKGGAAELRVRDGACGGVDGADEDGLVRLVGKTAEPGWKGRGGVTKCGNFHFSVIDAWREVEGGGVKWVSMLNT